jgi:hypothetical protein
MRLYSLLVIYCVFYFSSLHVIPTAYAQDQTGAGGTDKIKSMLLQPTGWRAHWRGPTGNTGFSDYLFEAREEKIVAKIQLASHPYHQGMSCERDVTILPNGVKLDSCLDRDITLLFDPNDRENPFKGKSPRDYEYKFKAK